MEVEGSSYAAMSPCHMRPPDNMRTGNDLVLENLYTLQIVLCYSLLLERRLQRRASNKGPQADAS